MRITTARHYMIEKIQKCLFTHDSVKKVYLLQIIRNGLLHVPSSKNQYFNEKNDIILNIDTLEFSSEDIVRLRAEGAITKTFGDAGDGKKGTVKPLLALHGKLLVRYLARDFQLYVNPLEGKPLFSLPAGGLFDNETSIGLPKGSIGLFSDLTINTLYIKGEFDKDKTVTPLELGKRVKIKTPGVDIMQTNNGPQLILHAPKVAFVSGKKQSVAPHYYEIGQVMLNLQKKIKAINGNAYIGEKEPDPFSMLLPESIQKSISFQTDNFSIGSSQPSADSSIQLQINGIKTRLSFKEPFKSTGLYGFRLPAERLRIVSTQNTSWYLDDIKGKSMNLPQNHYIKKSSVQTIKTKMAADTSDPAIITFNSCGFRVSSDTVTGGIMIMIPKSNLGVTGNFPFIPVRKFSSYQDIRIIVKKGLPFPQFVSFDSKVKNSASIIVDNFEFKTTETWFDTDTLLPSSNTSCSNLFLGFSFKELLKNSVSVFSVEETSQPCTLNIYLDGSWRIVNEGIVKTTPAIPVLLKQCFSEK